MGRLGKVRRFGRQESASEPAPRVALGETGVLTKSGLVPVETLEGVSGPRLISRY